MLAKFCPFLTGFKIQNNSQWSWHVSSLLRSVYLAPLTSMRDISVSGSTDQHAHMATACRSFGAMTPFDRHELSSLPQSSALPFAPALKTRNRLIRPYLCCCFFPTHLHHPLDSTGLWTCALRSGGGLWALWVSGYFTFTLKASISISIL